MNADHLDQPLIKSRTSDGIRRHYLKRDLFKTQRHNTILFVTTLMIFITVSCHDAHKNTQESDSRIVNSKSCSELPAQFQSYEETESRITSVSFKFQDAAITYKRSWIRGTSYYSCD